MITPSLRPLHLVLVALTFALPLRAQTSAPTSQQLASWISIRQQRVDLLRDEIKEIDDRIESRLGVLLETLKSISDSKDSRTKVARMKEDTGKRLAKSIDYYDQKRSALKEELRNPRLHLTEEEKRKMIAAFDARIEKRTQQILALYKSMPAHEDHERYKATGGGWYGTDYERNEEYEQNRRMTTHSNTQRDAITKHLDASIARIEWQNRTIKMQIAAADPAHRKVLAEELARNAALIAERRRQKLETLKPSSTPTHTVALKEAMDLDKALQTAVNELRGEFTTLFQRYNTFLNELSSLHASEAALAAKTPR